jgi:hypothetical protein
MSTVLRPFFVVPLLGFLTLAVACGGSIEPVAGNATDPTGGGSTSSSSSGGARCDGRPACTPGDTMYASQEDACKEVAGSSCYAQSACGETIWCQHTDAAQCAGYPSCPAGYGEVKACVPDADCKKVSMCGATILCQKADPPCEGPMPVCDDGDTQIASPSQCLQDDARCYSRANACGYTIWCTGPAK